MSEAQRRPAAAASQPARAHPQTDPDTHDRNSGCPHCGAVASQSGGSDHERTTRRPRTVDVDDSPDGDPVDDVDERSVVARLRDAL
ncbi:hypothetical protein ACFQDG_19840 [Natronoarchaeum mannanilyticum]|uniref:hypothetical protein n=1 Tax=Natronoarchaeum mannanilyticum TaxID=926360 RepID=UPI003620D6F1